MDPEGQEALSGLTLLYVPDSGSACAEWQEAIHRVTLLCVSVEPVVSEPGVDADGEDVDK